VLVSHAYSFDVGYFIKTIPKPEKISLKEFLPIVEELFTRIMLLADNTGSSDNQRALNFLVLRYDIIYSKTAECYIRNCTLTNVEVRLSRNTGSRNIQKIVFTFIDRATGVPEKYFCSVDTTDEFPFLVSKLQPYYEIS
jgi:hypothetical protein